jgi:CheY-like chemotaxis protein
MPDYAPVLIAEDDPNDVFLLQRAFAKAEVKNPVAVVVNGQEAIDYLGGEGAFADRRKHPLPSLVFLDLKMPLVDGFEVLAWLQGHARQRDVPVIVLSSSNHDQDVERAIRMGAKEYRVKPHQIEELVEIVRQARDRWLNRPER